VFWVVSISPNILFLGWLTPISLSIIITVSLKQIILLNVQGICAFEFLLSGINIQHPRGWKSIEKTWKKMKKITLIPALKWIYNFYCKFWKEKPGIQTDYSTCSFLDN